VAKLEEVILRDITGNRPAAGIAGRLFYDTTLEKWQRDTGAAWEDCEPPGMPGRAYLTGAGGWPSTTEGCAAAAKREYGTNDVDLYVLGFDKDADEFAQWTAKLADWDGGTITMQFVWTCTAGAAAQTVEWNGQGRSYGDGEDIDQAWGAAVAVSDTWIGADKVHVSAESGAITLAGTPALCELVHFRVFRDVSDDDLGCDGDLILVIVRYTRA